MNNKKEKIVVTGGAGFIGSNIVEELVQLGYEVTVVDDLSDGRIENLNGFIDKINFVKGDITNIETLKKEFVGAKYVIHQAAMASVPRSINDPVRTNAANIDGTLNVFVAAKETGVKRVVYASSSSVYGDSEVLPKNESMDLRPLSLYAAHKMMGEIYGNLFFKLYGLETVGLRYFNVFGPRQNPNSEYAAVMPIFINKISKDESPTIFGDGETTRDFTYIDNVVKANILACLSPNIAGQIFNVAAGEKISLNSLVSKINSILNKNIKPVYSDFRGGDIKHSLADIKKAEQMLGYKVVVGFELGLKKTIDYLTKHHA